MIDTSFCAVSALCHLNFAFCLSRGPGLALVIELFYVRKILRLLGVALFAAINFFKENENILLKEVEKIE